MVRRAAGLKNQRSRRNPRRPRRTDRGSVRRGPLVAWGQLPAPRHSARNRLSAPLACRCAGRLEPAWVLAAREPGTAEV